MAEIGFLRTNSPITLLTNFRAFLAMFLALLFVFLTALFLAALFGHRATSYD
jgi:hypothetical protein